MRATKLNSSRTHELIGREPIRQSANCLALLLICTCLMAPGAMAEKSTGVGRGKAKLKVVREETYEERQARLDREKQWQDDLAAYNARGGSNAPNYMAIAYSKTTYRWGFAYGYENRPRAVHAALERCGPGAEYLCWSKDSSYCALADGPRSYGAGTGRTATEAKAQALSYASKVSSGARIVLVVGGRPPTFEQP